jgi:biotin carboxyl carrier protein
MEINKGGVRDMDKDQLLRELGALLSLCPPGTEVEIVQKGFKLRFVKAVPRPPIVEIKPSQAKNHIDQERGIVALSPMVGIFSVYYTENGIKKKRETNNLITAETVLCSISAMGQSWPIVLKDLIRDKLLKPPSKDKKLTIRETDRFVIKKILVSNGETVEYKTPLFILEPA